MDNQDMVVLLHENGNEVQGRIINIVEIDGQEYLLYSEQFCIIKCLIV